MSKTSTYQKGGRTSGGPQVSPVIKGGSKPEKNPAPTNQQIHLVAIDRRGVLISGTPRGDLDNALGADQGTMLLLALRWHTQCAPRCTAVQQHTVTVQDRIRIGSGEARRAGLYRTAHSTPFPLFLRSHTIRLTYRVSPTLSFLAARGIPGAAVRGSRGARERPGREAPKGDGQGASHTPYRWRSGIPRPYHITYRQ